MNLRKLRLEFLALAGIALAFFGGYLTARNSQSDRQVRRNVLEQGHSTGSEGAINQYEGRQLLAGDSWKEAKVQLMKRWESSPGVLVDLELREETRCLLDKVSNEDLEVWLRELRSDDEEEDSEWDIQLQMHEMVLEVLAPRAGGGLIRSLDENPLERISRWDIDEALNYWIKNDPSAVLRWLDGEVPAQIQKGIDGFREDALEDLAAKNPIEFEARLAQVDQDTRESLLSDFADRRANPEGRAEILERAARSPQGEAMALLTGLLRGEGEVNPQLALATLSELQISDADRAELDDGLLGSLLRGVVIGSVYVADVDRSQFMQGWLERNSDRVVPIGVLSRFEDWSQSQTKYAVQWVSNLPSGTHFDTFARSLIRKAAGTEELKYPAAANLVAKIGDPAIRRATLIEFKESWKAQDAEAEATWEDVLSASDREREN